MNDDNCPTHESHLNNARLDKPRDGACRIAEALVGMDGIVDGEPMRPSKVSSSRRLKRIAPTKDVK